MGLLDIFKTPREIAKEEIVEVPWHVLGKMDQLDEIVEANLLLFLSTLLVAELAEGF